MNRRTFLENVEVLSLTLLCGSAPALVSACASYRFVESTLAGDRVVVSKAAFGEGPNAHVDRPEWSRPIYLNKDGKNAYSAVWTRCMHQGCQVEPAGDRLACPCHGSQYTLDGNVLKGPTTLPLVRFNVTTDAENIYIILPEGISL